MADDDPGADFELEANVYDEFAGALEACARACRRAAGIVRHAAEDLRRGRVPALQPIDVGAVRTELARIVRRTVGDRSIVGWLAGDDPDGERGKGGVIG